MARELDKLGAMEDLVIYLHGAPGSLILEDENGDVRTYSLDEEAIKQAFASTKAKIKRIFFEGCSVGEDPKAMADFGRLFKASEVSGFTWFHWTNDVVVTIPKGIAADDFKKYLEKMGLARWLPPSAPSMAELASMARAHEWPKKLWLEWFQPDMVETAPYADREGRWRPFPASHRTSTNAGATISRRAPRRRSVPSLPRTRKRAMIRVRLSNMSR
jgi:hypothetical protein